MATTALHTAATGMNAISTQIDVIANNLANVNTVGFKGSRVNFEDLLYQTQAQPGTENANGDQRPAGVQVGLGVRVANTDFNFNQGSPIDTGQPLDLYIEGNGFFSVDILDNQGATIGYTRAGNFFINSEGDMVLGNSSGPKLIPNINIPSDAITIDISEDGIVSVIQPGSATPTQVGQITLTSFINHKGLKAVGANIFIETNSSGPPIEANPGENGMGIFKQGFLEGSNVDPVKELVELIKAQRAFELNSQSIQAADQSLQVVANLRR
ncbi:MAG: flagellar basal-body rod protein FlgG [Phycisphaeraceae bacterium]